MYLMVHFNIKNKFLIYLFLKYSRSRYQHARPSEYKFSTFILWFNLYNLG